MLSKDEIEALLSDNSALTSSEMDALGEIGNISIGTSATTLYALLGERVTMTTPRVSLVTYDDLVSEHPYPFVAVEVQYTQGLKGTNLLIIKKNDAKVIANLMMGEGVDNLDEVELTEIHLSAIGEAMNQMMGTAATSMSQLFNSSINISPPKVKLINLSEDKLDSNYLGTDLVKIAFNLEIGKIVKSEVMQVIPLEFAKNLVLNLLKQGSAETIMDKNNYKTKDAERKKTPMESPKEQELISVNSFEMPRLEMTQTSHNKEKLDLILDVPLKITVELGRTKKTIGDILSMGTGSIIELDKLAGEPVDILVNGKYIAKGEVVVIDENFGVRVTEIISPIERVNKLQ